MTKCIAVTFSDNDWYGFEWERRWATMNVSHWESEVEGMSVEIADKSNCECPVLVAP